MELWKEELDWIKNDDLKEKTAKVWEIALERSVLNADDLNRIPFTLKVDGPVVTFMEHKRAVVHISKKVPKQLSKCLEIPYRLIWMF